MSENTKIEWCDSTFNPWIGCTKISPACDHCYAEAQMDTRMGRVQWGAGNPRSRTSAAYWKQPLRWNLEPFCACARCGWRGVAPKSTAQTSSGRTARFSEVCPACNEWGILPARRRVFCASLADVFDNEVDPGWRVDLFDLIANTPNLDWLLLTKRIGNATDMINAALLDDGPRWPWPNIWLGATICNQAEADRDIPKLLDTPAAKRFLSIEPMLGPIDVRKYMWPVHASWPARFATPQAAIAAGAGDEVRHSRQRLASTACRFVDWIICGGESGPHARPMHPDWVRSLRDQCAAAGVPFLFKQWGEWAPHRCVPGGDEGGDLRRGHVQYLQGDEREPDGHFRRGDAAVARIGKHAAGRLLDGVEHNEVPA